MNKFIHPADSVAGLVGCAFWLVVLAGAVALLFGGVFGRFR